MRGRPTEYNGEEHCKIAIDLMSEGASITEVAAEIGVERKTLYNWMDKHPDFLHAIKRGEELSQAWWEKQGRTNLKDQAFSYTGWYMNMKNRFKWSDRLSTEQAVTVLPPITIPDEPTEQGTLPQ
jgi:hypothetical protein